MEALEKLELEVRHVVELGELFGLSGLEELPKLGFGEGELGVEVGGLAPEVAAALACLVGGGVLLNLAVIGGGRANVAREETCDAGFKRLFVRFGNHGVCSYEAITLSRNARIGMQ